MASPGLAVQIDLGEIVFTGNFTLNPAYNYTDVQPYGTFGEMRVSQASGLFSPYMMSGDLLAMQAPFIWTQPSPTHPMAWSIGGYAIDTDRIWVTGAYSFGSYVLGTFLLTGHGFTLADYPPIFFSWSFTAPPRPAVFTTPVTGPITMTLSSLYNDGTVAAQEPPPTTLLAMALALLVGLGRIRKGTCRAFWRGYAR